MKAFWALMGLLAIAAVIVLATEFSGKTAPAATPPKVLSAAPPPSAAKPPPAPADGEPAPNQTVLTFTDKPTKPTPQPPSPLVVVLDLSKPTPPAAVSPATSELKPDEPKVADPVPAEATPKEASRPPAQTPLPAPTAPTGSANPSTQRSEENLLLKIQQDIAAERAAAAAKKAAGEAVVPPATEPATDGPFGQAKAEVKPDGSLLVEGKYIIKGKGTQAEPFKVTWDHLISAQHDYNPKEGQKTIPARIQALHEKWVEITGYIAFPLMANETDELLSMMNQWDGCCIGIPPTPYDAIEVRLTTAVAGDSRLTTYGSLKGVFKVDPHLVGGWLVGLYVMDQGKLTPVAYGGVAP